ncbi:hypothetical protein J1G42_12410 [Cellulomonas sp. zg-ZUI222]|uniref:hypothetical protein n=1 Tax=Cellulomonas TaxID=1707 RepID=UPI001A951EEC|nr:MULTISPECIES: hypothetical protein [Cellulomonas]MBO0900971.1 hypothetical protein [Cellulomonas sp. zg-ZUI22]MBO0921626.1 hypothetical protein [Cellulomonas wangleii]
MTAPDPTPDPAPAVPQHTAPAPSGAARVVGPRAVLEVCLRAAAVLLVMAAVMLAVLLAMASRSSDAAVDAQAAVMVVVLMYGLHLVALAVLGWPGGLLTAHLMRHETSERRHVIAFAVAGGLLGGATLAAWGGGVAILVWAAVGAAVAGGARAWTGLARRRRALLRATHPSAPS